MDGAHIIPHAAGGEDKPENLLELCRGHHHESHRLIMVALARIALRTLSHDELLIELKREVPMLRATPNAWGDRIVRRGRGRYRVPKRF